MPSTLKSLTDSTTCGVEGNGGLNVTCGLPGLTTPVSTIVGRNCCASVTVGSTKAIGTRYIRCIFSSFCTYCASPDFSERFRSTQTLPLESSRPLCEGRRRNRNSASGCRHRGSSTLEMSDQTSTATPAKPGGLPLTQIPSSARLPSSAVGP